MVEHERMSDMPAFLRWTMVFIKQLGFPIVICIYLMYQQYVGNKEQISAMNGMRDVLVDLKNSIDQQNKIMIRRSRDD